MRQTKGIVIALAAVLLLAATVGVASAANKAGSKVEITRATGDEDGVDIRGNVSSRRARCEKNPDGRGRPRRAAARTESQDFKLGVTTTNARGSRG
jgi:catalase (peroxidase I)